MMGVLEGEEAWTCMGPVFEIVKGEMSYGTDTDKPQDLLADGAQAYTQTRPKINRGQQRDGHHGHGRDEETAREHLLRVLWEKEYSSET